ncbi:hypothetical protein BU17DRAFT_95413 [Hysterangium stoloniferum]|nr:hypothetical protein BU17DRAFT_95413 [Hysterangium stoloniferum]
MPGSRKPTKAEKKTVKARLTLGEIAKTKQASKRKHGLAAKTTQDYDGHVRQGKEWLAEVAKELRDNEGLEHPRGCPEGLGDVKWTSFDLIHAFDETPNRASPWALATFISFKCFTNSCGQSTAEGIHAGFQKYWDRADVEGLYQGPWRWDEEANCAFGNPSTAYDVQETISAVRKKGGTDQKDLASAYVLRPRKYPYGVLKFWAGED